MGERAKSNTGIEERLVCRAGRGATFDFIKGMALLTHTSLLGSKVVLCPSFPTRKSRVIEVECLSLWDC